MTVLSELWPCPQAGRHPCEDVSLRAVRGGAWGPMELWPRPAPCECGLCPTPPPDPLLPAWPPSADCCSSSPCHMPGNGSTELGVTVRGLGFSGLAGLRPHTPAPRAARLQAQPPRLCITPWLDSPPRGNEGSWRGCRERVSALRLWDFLAPVKFTKVSWEITEGPTSHIRKQI